MKLSRLLLVAAYVARLRAHFAFVAGLDVTSVLRWTWEVNHQIEDCRSQIADFRVSDCRSQIADFRVSDCRSQIADFRFQISDFRFQIADFRLQISDVRLRFRRRGLKSKSLKLHLKYSSGLL